MTFVTLIVLIGCLWGIPRASQAESIFVDASSAADVPDGSAIAPFKTITQALKLAQKIRFGVPAEGIRPSQKTINLHVAAGTYVGSFAPSDDPCLETLPLLLNVPRLKLCGALMFDEAGNIVPGTGTILRASTRQGPKQHLVVVTRTNPIPGSSFPETLEMAGDAVTISGFYIDGWAADGTRPDTVNAQGSALISLDGVTDFVVRENYLTHAGSFGITTRLSSGRIENNLVIANRGIGLNVTAGSETFPARLEIQANRVRNNLGGVGLLGAAQTENDRADLFSAHPFRRIPLPKYYDRAHEPEEVPDQLSVHVAGNEFSGSGQFGIRAGGYIRDQYQFHPLDPADETANVSAQFVGNICTANGHYGIVVDAGQIPAANPRKHVVNLDLSFEATVLEANGLATVDGRERAGGSVYFGFWRYASSISAVAERDLSFKFAHDSTIRISGDITQLNYENRAIDPADGTPTNNTLLVNNDLLAGFCVPLYGCIHELPPSSPDSE